MLIRDILARNLDETIPEVIKVSQTDEKMVYNELTEYVATLSIKRSYRLLLKAIADSRSEPTDNNEVWISGFFGSGKSSFAKNLGYALADYTVMGHQAAELFKRQMNDPEITAYLDVINRSIPMEVIMFDISADRNMRQSNEQVAEIMYRALLNGLGYASDYTIAELEIELEQEGKLDEFITRFDARYPMAWRKARNGATSTTRASAILHEMEPATYSSPDSWAVVADRRTPIITVTLFVERAFELMAQRRPGKALTFIIDEVGQYVSRSSDKLENLRSTIEALGKEGRNRTKQRRSIAPIWTLITSQERLNEIVDAIEGQRVQIARVQDRFHYRVDLEASDIREVATRRVLAKREEALSELRRLYAASQGILHTATRLEESSRQVAISEDDFVNFYPYLPHFIDLSIDIVSGIRMQPGADRHLGGSNRTIIKQSYEMLVSEQTDLKDRPVGQLVTLDLIYDLVNVNFTADRRKDIIDVSQRFPDDGGWATRVAKALCLLGFIKDLPRTTANIAAMLVDRVGQPSPIREVEEALNRLEKAQFVRRTAEGYKLQTAQEKSWDMERAELAAPNERQEGGLIDEAIRQIFTEAAMKVFRYHNRSLQVGVQMNDRRITAESQVPLTLIAVTSETRLKSEVEKYRSLSRDSRSQEIFWLFVLDEDLHAAFKQLHSSRRMIEKYSYKSGREQSTDDKTGLLQTERREEERLKIKVRQHVERSLAGGQGIFQGVAKDASDLGQGYTEIFHNLFEFAVPTLYPYLPLGARRLKGQEVNEVLTAANLHALSPIFYENDQGLALVIQDGARYVPNRQAPIAEEILRYLKSKQEYGESVNGRDLSAHFGGLGYGWDDDILRLVLAVLLRAGAVEVTTNGIRYRDYLAPQARTALTNVSAFRSALFAPRNVIDIRTLVQAAQNYEALSSRNVEAEETAIATALRAFAADEVQRVLPVKSRAEANRLPITEFLDDYYQRLYGMQNADPADCVSILAGEGKSLKQACDRARQIGSALTEPHLELVRDARNVLAGQWPILQAQGTVSELLESVTALQGLLDSDTFYEHFSRIHSLAHEVAQKYTALYLEIHESRYTAYARAVETIKGRPEWLNLPAGMSASVLSFLQAGLCSEADLASSATVCAHCRATIDQMKADVDALSHRTKQSVDRMIELTALPPTTVSESVAPGRVRTIKVAEFFKGTIDDVEALEATIEQIRAYMRQLLADGVRIHVE